MAAVASAAVCAAESYMYIYTVVLYVYSVIAKAYTESIISNSHHGDGVLPDSNDMIYII